MQNIVCIIKEFEGIIGAILGSAFTLIITDILKKIGKLKIYLNNFEGRYWYNSKDNRYEPTTSKKYGTSIESFRFKFDIDVYNSSELPKIMRDLKISIYKNKKFLKEVNVNDEETRRVVCRCITVDKTTIFNIPGKESYNLKLSAEIPEDIAFIMKDGLIIKLKYKNKNKYFKIFCDKVSELEE
ncbi:MAG: hypothetical protein MR411_04900 [Tenericutes bacterium]|nr:hypothetical protein [Mycoplasmatota bacterium]